MYEGQTVSIWDKSHTPQRSSWQLSQSNTRCGRVWNVFWVPNVTSSVNSGSQVTCRLFLHNQIICLKHQIFILLMNLKFEQKFTGVSCLCSAQHQFGTVQLGTKIATLKMLCLFYFFFYFSLWAQPGLWDSSLRSSPHSLPKLLKLSHVIMAEFQKHASEENR